MATSNFGPLFQEICSRVKTTWKDGAMQDLNALGPRLQLDLLRDWPKLALDRELWRGVASRC